MGGCSSKPKTAECEGAMDLEEDMLRDEAARKSTDTPSVSIDAGLKEVLDMEQERALENKKKDQKGFVETQAPYLNSKHDPEKEEQILEGIDVTINDKENGGIRASAPESQQLVKEAVTIPWIHETATLRTEKVREEEGTLDMKGQSCSLKNGSEPSVETVFSKDQTPESHEVHMVQGETTLELQASPLDDANSKPKNYAPEETVKQSQESQTQDLFEDEKHVKLHEISGNDNDHDNRTDIKECEQICNGNGGTPEEMFEQSQVLQPQELLDEEKHAKFGEISGNGDDRRTVRKECEPMCNGNGGTNEEGEDTEVVEKVTELVSEDKGTSKVNKEPPGGQSGVSVSEDKGTIEGNIEPLIGLSGVVVTVDEDHVSMNDKRALISSHGIISGISADTGPDNMKQLLSAHSPLTSSTTTLAEGGHPREQPIPLQDASHVESAGPRVEQELSRESWAELTAAQCALPGVSEDHLPMHVLDIQLVDTLLLKEAHSQVLDGASGGSGHSPIKAVVNYESLLPAAKEEVSAKFNGSAALTHFSKHIQAEDIPTRDIDEVLEKLASEFERQESLSRSTH